MPATPTTSYRYSTYSVVVWTGASKAYAQNGQKAREIGDNGRQVETAHSRLLRKPHFLSPIEIPTWQKSWLASCPGIARKARVEEKERGAYRAAATLCVPLRASACLWPGLPPKHKDFPKSFLHLHVRIRVCLPIWMGIDRSSSLAVLAPYLQPYCSVPTEYVARDLAGNLQSWVETCFLSSVCRCPIRD